MEILTQKSKLPEGWESKRLIDVIEIIDSGCRPKGGVSRIEKGIPSIGAEHLNSSGSFNLKNIKFIPENFYKSMNRGKIQYNDVLVVKDGATTGKVSIVNEKFPYKNAAINEHVFLIRGKKEVILQKYLFYFLFSDYGQKQIDMNFQGTAQGGINKKFIENFFISIPYSRNPKKSLKIQQKIVSKLDAFFDSYNKLKEEKQLAKENYEKILYSLIEELIFRDKEYQKVKMEQVIVECRYGTSKKTSSGEGRIPVLRIPNVIKGEIDFSDLKGADFSENEIKSLRLNSGDILLVRTNGSQDLVGRGAVVPDLKRSFLFASYLIKLKPKLDIVNPYFLNYALMTDSVRNQLIDRSHTTAGQYNINSKQIKSIEFPLPTINKQNEIVNTIKKIKGKIIEIFSEQKNIDYKLKQLPKSVLSKTFKGELVN